jgi:hypothetical protein
MLTSLTNPEILMHMFQGNALGIKLIQAYIRNHSLSIEEYLSSYRDRFLNQAGVTIPDHDRVIAAFEISFEAFDINHNEAADVLQTCAFIHNEDIRYELMRRGLGQDG